MRNEFLRTLQTPSVERAQLAAHGRVRAVPPPSGEPRLLGPDEISFIAARDSFYLASVGETGWPYVQHRGGPRGFLRVVAPNRVAFPDYSGNRQLLSTGNIAADGRVALFLMDYPARERLKIIGHARVETDPASDLLQALAGDPHAGRIERAFAIEVVGFDWNCSQFITPRFTVEEVEEAARPLRHRIAELEAALARLESQRRP